MKKIIIIIIAVSVLASAGYIIYHYLKKGNNGYYKLSGELEMKYIDLAFLIPGKITKKYFNEGQSIKSGDLIAELDPKEYQLQAELAKANLYTAELQLNDVKSNNANQNSTQKKIQLEQTRSQYQVASINKEIADERLSYTKLYSPINGTVIVDYKNANELAQAGAPIISIGDTSKLWLRTYLPENLAHIIKLGDNVTVKVDSLPNENFYGIVTFISDKAEFTPKQIQTDIERVKLVYRIKIDIVDTKGVLKAGIPADAHIKK